MVTKAAGFVIFKRVKNDLLYLLLQTSYGEHHWTPPKGHVDPGEIELITAYRETKEESGLDKNDIKVYDESKKILKYDVKGKPKIVVYWLAELINEQAKVQLSDEHQEFKWLCLQEACNYGKYEDLKEMLNYFDDFIKKNLIK